MEIDTVTTDVGPDQAFDVEVVDHALDVADETRLAGRVFKGSEFEGGLIRHEAQILRPKILTFKVHVGGPNH